ncbi:actin-like ATPase domain-containing protein [Hypoxylon sp. FL1150]|nr:actin-like ATPase domain-containing protein [Hypoxylon sp. FL1150]
MSTWLKLPQRPKDDSLLSASFDDNASIIDNSHLDESSDILVIGIDFGTTYSGASWATHADFQAGRVNLVTCWPGTDREEGKAPTELFFEDDKVFWGYDIPPDSDPVRWFKLLLLKDEDLTRELKASEFILRGGKMLRENEKTAVDLVADYLREFWKHVVSEITKTRGSSVIDALRFHVVITLPAIWKGYARQSMHNAARKAGILDERDAGDTTLSFAPEPEAAALATLCEPGRNVNEGDAYIICDAGGGTVDLITYEIQANKPLVVREAAEGTGGLCGGIFIDEAFERICRNRLGRRWSRLNKIQIKDIMKGEWEYAIKPQFTVSNSKKEYTVTIPAEAFPKKDAQTDQSRQPFIKNGRIHFRECDLKKAFTNVFADIELLIDGQISLARKRRMSITGIILVGGLGSSVYLYETLQAKYLKQQISVLQSGGMNPRTAISRGAVYKGFLHCQDSKEGTSQAKTTNPPIVVTSTIARANFGVVINAPFREGKHLEEDRCWDTLEQKWMAGNQMEWYIMKGEDCSQSSPVRKSFYRTFRTDFGNDLQLREEIFQCTDETPPSRHDESVSHLCTIHWNSDVSFKNLEWVTNSVGVRYKRLFYDLEFIPQGATVEIVAYVGGRKQKGKDSVVDIQYAC